ncbi:unnamed protein product [Lota lota]
MLPKSITTTAQEMTNAQTHQQLITPTTSLPPGTGNLVHSNRLLHKAQETMQLHQVTMSQTVEGKDTFLDRNPGAFKPKIGKGKQGESDHRLSKGCNCKRPGCLKNYYECYEVPAPFLSRHRTTLTNQI